jgi:hypothetical protein
MTTEQIAHICHEANRAYCEELGDPSQYAWINCPQWQRDSAIAGVEFRLANPDAPACVQHDQWCADKLVAGWKHGPVKDSVLKTHPCLIDYHELPFEQRLKDKLFIAIVNALREPTN